MRKLDTFYNTNKKVLKYFRKSLEQSATAQAYLNKRVSKESIESFYIGYAPNSNNLIDLLNEQDVSPKDAVTLGLVGKDGKDYYSVFRNRIMFPIINNGNIAGFGGRTLNTGMKYLNTKTTPIYNKGKILYLLDKAKKEIHKRKWALLVEGYFDVVTLHAFGFTNTVAVCGTALSSKHARILKRWANKVYVCLDGDEAGQKSANKAIEVLTNHKIYGGNVCLPNKMDPDEYLLKHGKDKFIEILKNC